MSEAANPAASASSPSSDSFRHSTVMDDRAQALARTYANALLAVADKEGATESILDEYDEFLNDTVRANPAFGELLRTPLVPTEEKDRILAKLLENRASATLTRFLRVLNRNQRLVLVEEVAREARSIWEKRQGRIRVSVSSAKPLDDDHSHRVGEVVQSLFGGSPIVSYRVDPGVIGGLVVQSGDVIYDMSVKNQLRRLHARLLEQKNHEIQNRRDR